MTRAGIPAPDGPDMPGNQSRPLRILQFTDLHLFADPGERLLGQDTRLTFESVLTLAQRDQWPPDALVLTGDLVHDERPGGYRYLRQRLEQLAVPFFCLPGNHDRIDLLAGLLDCRTVSGFRAERLGCWDLLLLDSTIPFAEGGHLDTTAIAELDRYAANHTRQHLLILLHHHPAPVGSAWIDRMQADNGGELLAIAAAHHNVRGIACGHVHQAYAARYGGHTSWVSAPSTCIQFRPNSHDFALDNLMPGYRYLDLYPDGRLKTAVRRTDAYPEPLSPSTRGY